MRMARRIFPKQTTKKIVGAITVKPGHEKDCHQKLQGKPPNFGKNGNSKGR